LFPAYDGHPERDSLDGNIPSSGGKDAGTGGSRGFSTDPDGGGPNNAGALVPVGPPRAAGGHNKYRRGSSGGGGGNGRRHSKSKSPRGRKMSADPMSGKIDLPFKDKRQPK
jgi:hypothetical protein